MSATTPASPARRAARALLPISVRRADLARRERLLGWINFLMLGVSALGLLTVLGPASWHRQSLIFAVGGCVLAINQLAHRRGAPLAITANVLIGAAFVALSCIVFATGGIGLAAPFALAMIPMLAVLLVGPRAGLAWAAAVLAEVTLLAWLHSRDTVFPGAAFPSPGPVRFLIGVTCVVMLLCVLALMFAWRSHAILADLSRVSNELDEARVAAQAANVAKDRFLANMSHEIRTPMNGVLGMLDLLRETELTTDQQRSSGVAYRSAQALLYLLNDIVDLARVASGALAMEDRPFDLRELVREVVDIFTLTAEAKGFPIHVDHPRDAPAVLSGDAHRLRQVLVNLVGNAVKFTLRGKVTVRVRAGDPSGVQIDVVDTGPGISEADQQRIFEAFVQADASTTRRYGGTGLGLAISRQIIEQMGGRLTLTSRQGFGSTFHLHLPLPVLTEAPGPARTPAFGHQGNFPGARVLVVEDNPVNWMVVERMLIRLGCTPALASEGREALRITEQQTFDLVLMDCQMPEMDGYEATALLRARGFDRPILALTAHAMEGDRERCLKAGMDDYLTKPLRREALVDALARWLPGRAAR